MFDPPPNFEYNLANLLGSPLIITTAHVRLLVVIAILSALALISSRSVSAFDQDSPARAVERSPVPSGRVVFSAESGGAWNLYTADVQNGAVQRIASNASPARDPAVSPDGATIAFRGKRDGVWEIYSMPASGGTATRLTRGMVYSGAPVWSPDGNKIAFESYAQGDLDIFVMNADGSQVVDLTADSPTHDYAPAWSPDGKWIAFTSWRTGLQQIFIVAADCTRNCRAINLSQNKFDDEEPVWSPDGRKIAFVSDRDGQRAIYTADYAIAGLKNVKRITFSGWDDQPAWSRDGQWIAFVSPRPTRQPTYVVPADGGIPHRVENDLPFVASVTWAPDATIAVNGVTATESTPLFPVRPDLAAPNSGYTYEMRRITSTRLDPGINKLNGRLADSFIALQARVKQEVGYDFLGTLAEMLRPLDLRCDITCDTLSWHKAGRAFDTRLDYVDARGSALEIVREDQQGETFWRVFLRAAAQDGTMGEPMKQAPWDLSYRARWLIDPGAGGAPKPVPYGFYVDFTELARQYGWYRISAQDSDDFHWKTNKIGAEYWHFETRQGLNWYQAIREVYSESDVKPLVDWNGLVRQSGYDPYILYLKGIPAPPSEWKWYALAP